jgi:hypothetical protein
MANTCIVYSYIDIRFVVFGFLSSEVRQYSTTYFDQVFFVVSFIYLLLELEYWNKNKHRYLCDNQNLHLRPGVAPAINCRDSDATCILSICTIFYGFNLPSGPNV